MGTYGAHRIRCHSAFQHYEMFHGHSTGGNNYGSIFNININNGGCFGGGGFGAGFGAAFGSFFGRMFGGFLGAFGMGGFCYRDMYGSFFDSFGGFSNMFGGFGNMFGGGFGLGEMFGYELGNTLFGGGISGLFGGSKSKKSKKSKGAKESDKPETTTEKDKKCEGKDIAKHNELREKLNTLKASKTPSSNEIVKLYNEVKGLKDKQLDESEHDSGDKKAYELLLKDIETAFDITTDKDGKATGAKAKAEAPAPAANNGSNPGSAIAGNGGKDVVGPGTNGGSGTEVVTPQLSDRDRGTWGNIAKWNSLDFDSKSVEIPKIEGVSNGSDKTVTSENLKHTEDTHGPATVSGNVVISDAKHGNTKFPEYIHIKDSNPYNYKCAGVTSNGYAIYTTPAFDTNKNVYILIYDENENKFILTQRYFEKDAYGAGKPDKQNDKNNT